MSRVNNAGSAKILRSRQELELRLLQSMKANEETIGTSVELFIMTAEGKPANREDVGRLLACLETMFGGAEKKARGLLVPELGEIACREGGRIRLAAQPCGSLYELEQRNRILRAALNAAARLEGFTVTGRGFMPAFMPEGMSEKQRTASATCGVQVDVGPGPGSFNEAYRALLLMDVAFAFNRVSARQRRLGMFSPDTAEPLFAALGARTDEELARRLVTRLLKIRVYGDTTVGALLAQGKLTERLFDGLVGPLGQGLIGARAPDSVDSIEELMEIARLYRSGVQAAPVLLESFAAVDPDLLRVAFRARATLPPEKLRRMPVGGGFTVADIAGMVRARQV